MYGCRTPVVRLRMVYVKASIAMLSQGSVKHLERFMQVYNPEEKEEYRAAKRDCAGS